VRETLKYFSGAPGIFQHAHLPQVPQQSCPIRERRCLSGIFGLLFYCFQGNLSSIFDLMVPYGQPPLASMDSAWVNILAGWILSSCK